MAESSLPNDAARLVPAGATVPANRAPYSPLGGYGPGPADDSGNLAATLFEYLRIVDRRKGLILSILVTFVAIGAVRTLMQTPLYTATVRLQIDRSAAKIVEGGNIGATSEGYDYDFLRTQYELLQSRTIAERVASSLKLGEDADFLKPRDFSIVGAIRGLLSPARGGDGQSADKHSLRSLGRRHRPWQSRGAPGAGLSAGRHHLHRSGAGPRPAHRQYLCRRLHRLQHRQAVRGQFLRQDLPRGSIAATEAAAGRVGKGAARIRREGADHCRQREIVDRREQSRRRQRRPRRPDHRAHQE